MASIPIENVASVGLVRDTPSHLLPPEAWTTAENMRAVEGGMQKLEGWMHTFVQDGSISCAVPPHFGVPVHEPTGNVFWLYASLSGAGVWDGAIHYNVGRAGGYTNDNSWKWNATFLASVPILNNYNDVPQYWPELNPAVRLADLPHWPSEWRCKVMRAFGPYLVAINIREGSNYYPHMVRWSHAAAPGDIPTSWDEADPTVDAGANDLSDVSNGTLVDAMPLGGRLLLYKEGATHAMEYIGGRFIFSFKPIFENVGLLSANCVAMLPNGKQHVMITQDDIIVHNGLGEARSIIDGRMKKEFFDRIDQVNIRNTFAFVNPIYNEVWFCYPTTGNTFPNRALIWNYQRSPNGVITEANSINFRYATSGLVVIEGQETWGEDQLNDPYLDPWSKDTGPWSEFFRRRVILMNPTAPNEEGPTGRFYVMDEGPLRDTKIFDAVLQRIGLGLLGRTRQGEWVVDHELEKMISRIWPRLKGNGPINIRIGIQQTVEGGIVWDRPISYDPNLQVVYDPSVPLTGRAMAIEFSNNTEVQWKCMGYKMDISKVGNF